MAHYYCANLLSPQYMGGPITSLFGSMSIHSSYFLTNKIVTKVSNLLEISSLEDS